MAKAMQLTTIWTSQDQEGTTARQAPLSFTISWSLFKLLSIESVMTSSDSSSVFLFSSCLQSFPASGNSSFLIFILWSCLSQRRKRGLGDGRAASEYRTLSSTAFLPWSGAQQTLPSRRARRSVSAGHRTTQALH